MSERRTGRAARAGGTSPESRGVGANDPARSDEDIELLRQLLVGREQQRLDRLERRQVQPEDLGAALPAAINSREQPDRALGAALSPTIEEGLKESVRKDPQTIADSIFPILGPAIRNYITDALNRFVQSTNTIIEHSISPRSLAWRFEALWTRKPFAEVVLMHSLFYKVEQAFLIYRESGLLLHQVQADGVEAWDGDLLSGMLTALGDFAHDSFKMDEGDALESFKVGGLKVRVVRSRLVLLAVAVRGTPPAELDARLEDTVHQIQADYHDQLATYAGDVSEFEGVDEPMRSLLLEKRRLKEKKRGFPWLGIVAVLIGVAVIAYFVVNAGIERSRRNAYVDRLRDEPGIVVTDARRRDGVFVVSGMRDALAADPASFLAEYELEPSAVAGRWQPFVSLDPTFVSRRVQARFAPPDGVQMRVDDGTLSVTGEATTAWIERVRTDGVLLAGVDAVDVAGCRAVDADAHLAARAKALLGTPDAVQVVAQGRTVRLIGRATYDWANAVSARLAAGGLTVTVDTDELVVLDAPEPLAQKVARVVDAPAGVTVAVDAKGVVSLAGAASEAWVERAMVRLQSLPGVTRIDSTLTISDAVARALRRARLALRPPEGIALSFADGVLAASGRAPHRWIAEARRFAKLIPGVTRFDDQRVVDIDRQALKEAAARLDGRVLRFKLNQSRLEPGQAALRAAIARDVSEIRAASRALGEPRVVVVYGLTLKQNGAVIPSLARARAEAVIDMLVRSEGLSRHFFQVRIGERTGVDEDALKAVRFDVQPAVR